MPATLPSVLFSRVGLIAADRSAFVTEVDGDYVVEVRHPHGGCIFVTAMRNREIAEGVAADLNGAIGAWASLPVNADPFGLVSFA